MAQDLTLIQNLPKGCVIARSQTLRAQKMPSFSLGLGTSRVPDNDPHNLNTTSPVLILRKLLEEAVKHPGLGSR